MGEIYVLSYGKYNNLTSKKFSLIFLQVLGKTFFLFVKILTRPVQMADLPENK